MSKFNSRYFNKITKSKDGNFIIKSSQDFNLNNEIFYYKFINNTNEMENISILFPKIIDWKFSKKSNNFLNNPPVYWYSNDKLTSITNSEANSYNKYNMFSEIRMEYIDYPSLSESFVKTLYSIKEWIEITNELYYNIIQNTFRKYTYTSTANDLYRINFYIRKNYERLEKFIKQIKDSNNKLLLKLLDPNLTINGKKIIPLEEVFERSYPYLENYFINDEKFTMIHGDLCLSNILCSEKNKIIKLIDPRGDFGGLKGVYGDSIYDIAKLYHSFDGLYDFVMFDKYIFNINSSNITFGFIGNYKDYHKRIKDMFVERICRDYEFNKVKLLEAWLFLSMLPLHEDCIEKQFILALIGLKKITNFLSSYDIKR